MQPTSPLCPTCKRPGHEVGGLVSAQWVPHREAITVDAERTIYRYGYRKAGTMRLMCEAGHGWSQERPVNLQPKRPQKARPRRGF